MNQVPTAAGNWWDRPNNDSRVSCNCHNLANTGDRGASLDTIAVLSDAAGLLLCDTGPCCRWTWIDGYRNFP
jgi:hypothetical protein